MKPWETLAHATTPDGSAMRLSCRDGEYVIWVDGRSLMSSRAHGSEESLAEAGCGQLRGTACTAACSIGGLGMGYTLRAALDVLPARARRRGRTHARGRGAAGDVRAESAKRVASAVGEGAMAVMLVHRYLEQL